MQHLDGSGAWPSYIKDARFLKVNIIPIDLVKLLSNCWQDLEKSWGEKTKIYTK
jgi:hypothetical protein